jgi:hypothetical protein
MRLRSLFTLSVLLGGLVLVGAACGDSESSGSETEVKLTDYAMSVDPGSVEAGDVKFTVVNDGEVTHEFVVVRADAASSLPTKNDDSVDEDKIAASDQQGEIEDIAAGETKSATMSLDAGSYVLFCNVVEGTGPNAISHFAEGMTATLDVAAS